MTSQRRKGAGYSIKVYNEGVDTLLAACDAELLGKVVRDETRGIKIDVNLEFYHGEIVGEKDLRRLMKEATILNLVGKRTIRLAMNLGLVDNDGILIIKGVPHAQVIHIMKGVLR